MIWTLMVSTLLAGEVALPPRVCVDPGHPSEVGSGTRGRYVTEVEVAWKIGVLLAEELRRAGIQVRMTKRSAMQTVWNRDRAEIANAAGADLMVRLHCDAGTGRGFAVYYPDSQGLAGGRRGPSADVLRASREAALVVHRTLAESLRGYLPDRGLRTDRETRIGARQGALTGSVFSKVPVVLVEMVVLSNPEDEAWIRDPRNQALYARCLSKAVREAVGPPERSINRPGGGWSLLDALAGRPVRPAQAPDYAALEARSAITWGKSSRIDSFSHSGRPLAPATRGLPLPSVRTSHPRARSRPSSASADRSGDPGSANGS